MPMDNDWLSHFLRLVGDLVLAVVLGGIIGLQREYERKAAGLRTHMLVSLGAALFVLSAREFGMRVEDISRVIQGVAAGIGFLGAGTILKLAPERQIKGLTTAAGIWLTAAIGVAAGAGLVLLATLATLAALVVLAIMSRFEII
ncbi:MAG: methyltransferase [Gemmataceae bacterium]